MAIKKSELYSSLWASCDELRGGMDASQYKDYVLALLFIKYVSDKYADTPYAEIKVPPGASFRDMVALKGKPDIGDQINKKIIAPLAAANQLSDMPDFNDPALLGSGQELVDKLTNLIAIFEDKALDFSRHRAEDDDLLGDAYEYLMRHFATESGKSKGQFYTPAEVSRIMAQIIGIRDADTTNDTTVYDPTCGSGSLLIKIGEEARAARKVKVSLYGQEKDSSTAGLARMNMILHDYAIAEIKQGNTLANPLFMEGDRLKTFDYVVANPPFSDKRWSTGLTPENDPHERFAHFGIPPAKQGDYAYLLHIVRSLKSAGPNGGGKGACILPHGVLFRGNAEADIRRNLIRKGYIKGIIGLPANLFYGTGIPACIVVIDKANSVKHGAHANKGIFMLDASKGFIKDGNKNRLRDCDIHKIVDVFNRRDDSDPRYARMVGLDEIEKNDYNLNLPRYIDSSEAEDRQDIAGHLQGGIPQADVDALQAYWDICPNLKEELFIPGSAGFQPASPLPKGWHTRGYLPHLDSPHLLQFITFRLADSVPAEQIGQWKQKLQWHKELDADSPEAAALRKQIESYEDAGHGVCHLREPRIAQMMQDALLHFDGQRYRMIAWCIMPNHVHVLIELIDPAHSLSSVIHSWKSFTANAANKILGRSGAFWMEDYFDRYIRDETHLHSTLEYIRQNPVKAGLVRQAEDWPWAGDSVFQPACGQDGRAPGNTPRFDLAVDKQAIKPAIYQHPEFAGFIARMNAHFESWREQTSAALKTTQPGGFHPKDLIHQMSESLLLWYAGQPLIDQYDVYQHLMDYWAETMQDDCYLISATVEDGGGWKAETYRIVEKDKKGKEKDKGWACDLVPKQLIVNRYYAEEQVAIRELEAEMESVAAQLAELEESGNAGFQPASGQDGRAPGANPGAIPGHTPDDYSNPFAELDKVNKAEVGKRLKELGTRASSPLPAEDADEIAALNAWLKLNEQESELKKRLKSAEAELDMLAYTHYPKLGEDEIKTLVVDDKWLAALNADIHGEMDRISQRLTRRVKELAERYETPLPRLEENVAVLHEKVAAHLRKMGFAA